MKRRIPAAGAGAEPRPPGQNPVKLGTTRYNSVKKKNSRIEQKNHLKSLLWVPVSVDSLSGGS